jgi:16S rRNA (uracil1498-N3)-methyltransferase
LHRIFIDESLKVNSNFKINDGQAHHLFNVLRMNTGDEIEVVDSNSNVYISLLEKPNNIKIEKKIKSITEPAVSVSIFQGVPKKDKFEQVIKMGTEIGATDFIAVSMKRSVVKIKEDKIDKLLSRWNKIALAAAKQSKRQEVPAVRKPISFNEMLEELSNFDLVICLYENEKKLTMKDIDISKKIKKIAIIIGPEGGIADAEMDKLDESGVTICSLGPRIMRTETAGIAALSILLYKSGDI